MRLAPANLADAEPLAQILADWIDETTWMPNIHTPHEDIRFLTHLITTCEVTTAHDHRGLQGFLARDGAKIQALYLLPHIRGKGLGKRLLDLAKSRSDRLDLWSFQSNAGARAFYVREGFDEVELTDGAGNDEQVPDVRLVWTKEDGT